MAPQRAAHGRALILSSLPGRLAQFERAKGGSRMKRIVVLACAGLALGMASPLAAEQTVPPATQPEQLPPAPPMPPMPNQSHRWVDIDGASSRRASHVARPRHASLAKQDVKSSKSAKSSKSTKSSKSAKLTRHAKADKIAKPTRHAKAGKTSKAGKSSKASKNSRASASKRKAMQFSAKTVRSCHAMTYRQILRSSSCRTMISQELSAPSAKRAKPASKKNAAAKAVKHKARARKARKR